MVRLLIGKVVRSLAPLTPACQVSSGEILNPSSPDASFFSVRQRKSTYVNVCVNEAWSRKTPRA